MPLNVAQALADLRQDPERFLARHPIHINSGNHGPQQLSAEAITRATATRRTSVLHRTVDAHDGLSLTQFGAADAIMVDTYAVQMIGWGGAPNFVNIPAPQPGGPWLLVTTPLTGCCFGVVNGVAGAIQCCHAQHAPGQTSAQLRTTMGGLGMDGIYGDGQEYQGATNYALIIGIPHNGAWRIYCQRQSRGLDRFSIRGVDRII